MGGKSMRNWNGLVKMNNQQLAKQEEEFQPCSRDLMGPTPSSHPIHPPISQEQPRCSWALAGSKTATSLDQGFGQTGGRVVPRHWSENPRAVVDFISQFPYW